MNSQNKLESLPSSNFKKYSVFNKLIEGKLDAGVSRQVIYEELLAMYPGYLDEDYLATQVESSLSSKEKKQYKPYQYLLIFFLFLSSLGVIYLLTANIQYLMADSKYDKEQKLVLEKAFNVNNAELSKTTTKEKAKPLIDEWSIMVEELKKQNELKNSLDKYWISTFMLTIYLLLSIVLIYSIWRFHIKPMFFALFIFSIGSLPAILQLVQYPIETSGIFAFIVIWILTLIVAYFIDKKVHPNIPFGMLRKSPQQVYEFR